MLPQGEEEEEEGRQLFYQNKHGDSIHLLVSLVTEKSTFEKVLKTPRTTAKAQLYRSHGTMVALMTVMSDVCQKHQEEEEEKVTVVGPLTLTKFNC